MSLRGRLASGGFAVTAEISPPRGASTAKVTETAGNLKDWVDAVNVTDNRGSNVRLASWAGSLAVLEAGLEPVMQMTCRDRNCIALQSDLLGAGGVLAGAVHYLYSIGFATQDSITLLAVTLMGGVYSMWGAVVAALLYQFLPALLNNWGVSADWLIILFGVGVLQVLTTAPAGLADQVPKDLARLGRLLSRRFRSPAPGKAP